MSAKYFAFIDGEQKGPFSLDQLPDAGVHPSTYVWSKEMTDWQRADSVEEIRNLFRHHIERAVAPEPVEPSAERPTGNPMQNGSPSEQPPRLRFGLPPVEEQIDINRPPQVSMTLAVMSLLLCFIPTGIAAVYFTYRAQKCWNDSIWEERQQMKTSPKVVELRTKAHDYERLAKMWMGLTVALGIIFWTLLFSVSK